MTSTLKQLDDQYDAMQDCAWTPRSTRYRKQFNQLDVMINEHEQHEVLPHAAVRSDANSSK